MWLFQQSRARCSLQVCYLPVSLLWHCQDQATCITIVCMTMRPLFLQCGAPTTGQRTPCAQQSTLHLYPAHQRSALSNFVNIAAKRARSFVGNVGLPAH
jgi:hypothetical protein